MEKHSVIEKLIQAASKMLNKSEHYLTARDGFIKTKAGDAKVSILMVRIGRPLDRKNRPFGRCPLGRLEPVELQTSGSNF